MSEPTYVECDENGETFHPRRGAARKRPKAKSDRTKARKDVTELWQAPVNDFERRVLSIFNAPGSEPLFDKLEREQRKTVGLIAAAMIPIAQWSPDNFEYACKKWATHKFYPREWVEFTLSWAEKKRAGGEWVDLRGWLSFTHNLTAMVRWLEQKKLRPSQTTAPQYTVTAEMKEAADGVELEDSDPIL